MEGLQSKRADRGGASVPAASAAHAVPLTVPVSRPRPSLFFRRPPSRAWLLSIALYTGFRIALDFGSRWLTVDGGFSLWYPPAGLDLAVLLWGGAWALPAILVTQVVSMATTPFGATGAWTVLYLASHLAGFGVGAWLLIGPLAMDARLPTRRDAVLFVLGGAIAIPAGTALLKVGILTASGSFAVSSLPSQVGALMVGDATGIAMVTPLLLIALRPYTPVWWDRPEQTLTGLSLPASRRDLGALAALAVLTFLFARVAFGGGGDRPDLSYLATLPLIWAALEYGMIGAATAVFALNVAVAVLQAIGFGLSETGSWASVHGLQLALVAISLFGILLGAVTEEDARRERSLRELEAKFSGAFKATPLPAMISDLDTSEVLDVNDAFERVSGYPRAEVVGRTTSEIGMWAIEGDRQDYLAAVERGESGPFELRIRTRDGEIRTVSVHVTSFVSAARRLLLAIAQDLTRERELQRAVIDVSEREQRRLGRDLHDDLGQALAGIGYLAASLARRLHDQGDGAASEAERIRDLVGVAVQRARAIAHGLNPILDHAPELGRALEIVASDITDQFGLECALVECSLEGITDRRTITHGVRIVQEAIGNAVRHGGARSIQIRLHQVDGGWCLCIEDDGRGLAPGASRGLGLRNMEYRAELLGGTLHVRNSTLGGVHVACRFPRTEAAC